MVYSETQFVNPATNSEWFSLSVVNMWDFKTKPQFYRNNILFVLKKNTAVNSISYVSEIVKPTEDQKLEIENMGYRCI